MICLLRFNRKMKLKKGDDQRELLTFLLQQMNDLFDMKNAQIAKEILQMVILSENVFEGSLILQFS